MPLPDGDKNAMWPPTSDVARYTRQGACALWYAGDPDSLAGYYGDQTSVQSVVGSSIVQRVYRWFWGTPQVTGEISTKLHVDLPQDIAKISSELLHSDAPRIRVVGPVYEQDGAQTVVAGVPQVDHDGEPVLDWKKGDPQPSTVATQARLEHILDGSNFGALLLEAAETQAALGNVGLKIDWDREVEPDMPYLTKVEADHMVVDFRGGRPVALTFWSVVAVNGFGEQVRWLERHERGAVYHGVYKGTADRLGKQIPFNDNPKTAHLAQVVDADGKVTIPEGVRSAEFVPNMLPDPMDRASRMGRSDFTSGMLGIFDAIDQVYTSLMRDIELGKGRLIVADYMLEDNGLGKGVGFNTERSVYSPLNMQPGEKEDAPITMAQFQIRVEQHIAAADHLAAKAVKSAGYNMRTMGEASDGAAITATQSLAEDRRSLNTRGKKIAYWQPALERLLRALLEIDKQEFSAGDPDIQVYDVEVSYPEAVQPDALILGQTAQAFKNAEASSIETRVSTIHPDWTHEQVQAEVAKIQAEQSVVDPTTFGLSPVEPDGGSGDVTAAGDRQQEEEQGTEPFGG
ncbi:portal protein [Curtobacterium phage Parvaparticeps]|nr:portal protein [Curtobacterium phage Parvaparticeps]